ncbi:MAG: 1-acyl-sn-glycerol-3-phosphate acyltransferase [Prevotellaceae bacterium]|jgi:1-acyl-sn-glycerol-3-phosphate acyltransferase|nr:1-acyl-sn-glycerol-3-phosphate acyltransferase [Prevotellaceae bacterium]
MIRFFLSIYDYFLSRRKLLFVSVTGLTIGMALACFQLDYKEDIAEFLPGREENKRINAVYQHAGNSSRLIVYFAGADTAGNHTERIIEAIDYFTRLLAERDSVHRIPEIVSQIDESRMWELTEFIRQNAPYFLTEEDYSRFEALLTEQWIASQIKEDKRLLMLPPGSVMKRHIQADPLNLFSPLLLKLKNFQAGETSNLTDGYIFSPDGKKGMVFLASPYGVSETAGNGALLSMIDETGKEVEQNFPEIKLSCIGAPAIAVTNARQIKKDSLLAITLSTVLMLLLLVYFFRSVRHIGLIFLSVLFGWLFALALLALFKGSISIIAVGIGSVFIGVAINYPLHLIDHLKHQPNVKQALKEITPPLLIGNITTVSAFLSLVFLSSDAMRDLGLFGSLLLFGSILFVLIFLPHLVKKHAGGTAQTHLTFKRLSAFSPEKRKWVVIPVLLLTVLFLYLSQFTAFDADMNNINYMTARQREDMQSLWQSVEKKEQEVVYFISEGRSLDSALGVYEQNAALLHALQQEGQIESISGAGPFLASKAEQQRRLNRWHNFWETRKESLCKQIENAARSEGFKSGSFAPFFQWLETDFTPRDESYFSPLTSLLAGNYLIKDEDKTMLIHLLYCEKGKTAELENTIRAAANGDAFVFDFRDAGQRMVDALSGDFNYVLYLCGLMVFLFLTLSFGRIELSLLSFLPLAIGWIWILGLMQVGDIRFNIVNIILATFIFGQGDDYTIFITEGLMYEYACRRKMLAAYKNSIVLSALVMFIGMGTLIFARHPALKSLAEVTVVGMFSVVLMAYLIPPAIFHWLTKNKRGFREIPFTLKRLLFSLYSFVVFLMGSLLITLTGFFIFGFWEKTEKKKQRYHALLCGAARFVIKRIPGVEFNYENLSGETFGKPAIIISNHQSHLDLMCLMMLTPRLVILTNDWVWNNPFYGRLIKFADFYPVSNGIGNSIGKLSDRVQNGYSIVVFPEGTRSADSSIGRFHRGAFYLAEMLELDILPVFIHGAGDVLPKSDFMLRTGSINIQVHPRIAPNDARYGEDCPSRAKQIRQYYRQTFASLCQRFETAAYFKNFVLHNYFYKGAHIERSVRKTLQQHACYSQWIDSHIGNGPVLVENSGYGVFAFLFAMVHKHLQVIAVEEDEDKVALARNCAGKPDNLSIYKKSGLPGSLVFDAIYVLDKEKVVEVKYTNE